MEYVCSCLWKSRLGFCSSVILRRCWTYSSGNRLYKTYSKSDILRLFHTNKYNIVVQALLFSLPVHSLFLFWAVFLWIQWCSVVLVHSEWMCSEHDCTHKICYWNSPSLKYDYIIICIIFTNVSTFWNLQIIMLSRQEFTSTRPKDWIWHIYLTTLS